MSDLQQQWIESCGLHIYWQGCLAIGLISGDDHLEGTVGPESSYQNAGTRCPFVPCGCQWSCQHWGRGSWRWGKGLGLHTKHTLGSMWVGWLVWKMGSSSVGLLQIEHPRHHCSCFGHGWCTIVLLGGLAKPWRVKGWVTSSTFSCVICVAKVGSGTLCWLSVCLVFKKEICEIFLSTLPWQQAMSWNFSIEVCLEVWIICCSLPKSLSRRGDWSLLNTRVQTSILSNGLWSINKMILFWWRDSLKTSMPQTTAAVTCTRDE